MSKCINLKGFRQHLPGVQLAFYFLHLKQGEIPDEQITIKKKWKKKINIPASAKYSAVTVIYDIKISSW